MSEHCIDTTEPVKKPAEGASGGCHDTFWASARLTDFYGNVFDVIGVVAMIVDVRGTIRMFNRKAVELTGFSRDVALGKDAFTLLFPAGVQDQARTCLLYSIESFGDAMCSRYPLVTHDGRMVSMDWNASVVRDDQGAVFGAICLGQPVSETACMRGEAATYQVGTCKCAGDTIHDILNQNQVAIGYMELAMDLQNSQKDYKCLMERAYNALLRSSDLALDVYRNFRDEPDQRSIVVHASQLAIQKK